MTRLLFRQVDVFGSGPYSGNPVAVVLGADALTDAQMAAVSEWTNLSECTFVLAPTDAEADYRVRIFSLADELPFAGHPTLGTCAAWLDACGVPRDPARIVQECAAGLVPIRRDGAELAFAAPPTVRSGPVAPDDLARVREVLGVDEEAVVDAAWADNGPGWVALLLRSAEEVLALTPHALPGRWDIGVAGPHPEGSDAAIEVRAFFGHGGAPLREDPVTGSLQASLAQWLLGSGRATAPYVAAQGTALGRDGRVRITESGGDVWVGGRTHVAIRGDIEV